MKPGVKQLSVCISMMGKCADESNQGTGRGHEGRSHPTGIQAKPYRVKVSPLEKRIREQCSWQREQHM